MSNYPAIISIVIASGAIAFAPTTSSAAPTPKEKEAVYARKFEHLGLNALNLTG